MDSKKRERSANFTSTEIQMLVSLDEKNKHVIENKKTDAVTNRDKEAAWKRIESSFNSCGVSTSARTWKTLKLKYEGMKKITKKKSSLLRQEMYRTGGGPSNIPHFNEVDETVLKICSNIQGLEARYDSDTILSPTPQSNEVFLLNVTDTVCEQNKRENEIILEAADIHEFNPQIMETTQSEEEQINGEESQKENKWDRWQPKTLRTKVSNVLKTNTATKSSVTCKLDELSAARLELVQLQMDTTMKQHKFIEDEHKLKMTHLANEEKRKQELHELVLQKMKVGPAINEI